MSTPSPNYFTCTLGQAASLNSTRTDQRIPDFIEQQAQDHPDLPAIGFYLPDHNNAEDWAFRTLTFAQLNNGICFVADTLTVIVPDLKPRQTIAVLYPSCAAFLFTWLGLIRSEHSALLIAPQCAPNAIAQLCQQCDVQFLFYDKIYEELADAAAHEARKLDLHLEIMLTPSKSDEFTLDHVEDAEEPLSRMSTNSELDSSPDDVAYLHHTSGTSTGIPKPIPQTHRGGLGVLPRLDGSQTATFTTTPLYHGGVADCFRAWTSNALIWLFPGKDKPITAANVVNCLDTAARAQRQHSEIPPVRYFSSVPYVLQMTAEDPAGLKHLQAMDIVGVGGAALPAEAGDDLVKKGVNLISRFGSAECGFLMSSHRDYEYDKEWQYLRPGNTLHLRFEPQDHGLSELVIEKGWPHMSKTNREDGSFATADLFAPHDKIESGWKYHSRADSQLTLITGKKFDPAPMEAAITASSTMISDVLIFGNGKPYPGALVFRSEQGKEVDEDKFKDKLKQVLDKINKESQSHARVSSDLVTIMPYKQQPLEKSSKGTVIRSKAEQRYSAEIEKAYESHLPSLNYVSDNDLTCTILRVINDILSSKSSSSVQLTPTTDLFSYGIDSIASIQIRQSLLRLLPTSSPKLPLSIVQDSGTVGTLSSHFLALRHGKLISSSTSPEKQMRNLIKKYNDFSSILSQPSSILPQQQTFTDHGITILLTGPTGSLGAHILSSLLSLPPSQIKHIYLLVRGSNPLAASERVRKSLKSRLLDIPQDFGERVTTLPAKLQDPDLGLQQAVLERIRSEMHVVLHLAWDVNFLASLGSFEKVHIQGLKNLLSFAATSTRAEPSRFVFCSSTASVASSPPPVPEQILSLDDIGHAEGGGTGYGRSKFVAEQICVAAARHARLSGNVSIVRVGQVSANQKGVWNASEAYPLMLSAAKQEMVGALPDLDNARRAQGTELGERLDWIPVDSAAQAFVDLALNRAQSHTTRVRNEEDAGVSVYHLLPPPRPKVKTWSNLTSYLAPHTSVPVVPVDEWLAKLEKLLGEKGADAHPALKLLEFWREAYSTKPAADETQCKNKAEPGTWSEGMDRTVENLGALAVEDDKTVEGLGALDMGDKKDKVQQEEVSAGFVMTQSLKAMPSLRDAREIDEEYVGKIWDWVQENV